MRYSSQEKNASLQYFSLQVSNLKKLLGVKKDTELYRKANIPKGTFQSWKNRGKIPTSGARTISDNTGLTVEQILGMGSTSLPKRRIESLGKISDETWEMLKMAAEILESEYDARESLIKNIRTFHRNIILEKMVEKKKEKSDPPQIGEGGGS